MMNSRVVAHARLACNYQSIEIQTLENGAHNFTKQTPFKTFCLSTFNNLLEKSFGVVREASTSKTSKFRFFCICKNRKNISIAYKKIHFWNYPFDFKVSLCLHTKFTVILLGLFDALLFFFLFELWFSH
jgi:hypothetical protein